MCNRPQILVLLLNKNLYIILYAPKRYVQVLSSYTSNETLFGNLVFEDISQIR